MRAAKAQLLHLFHLSDCNSMYRPQGILPHTFLLCLLVDQWTSRGSALGWYARFKFQFKPIRTTSQKQFLGSPNPYLINVCAFLPRLKLVPPKGLLRCTSLMVEVGFTHGIVKRSPYATTFGLGYGYWCVYIMDLIILSIGWNFLTGFQSAQKLHFSTKMKMCNGSMKKIDVTPSKLS